jgi:hypothetical protein
MIADRKKYPRTLHLPFSSGEDDDKILESDEIFHNKNVIVSIKMDGENFAGYKYYCHARSIDSGDHPSRSYAKKLWFEKSYLIDVDTIVYCENLYAKHQIHYNNLKSYLYILTVLKDNKFLSFNEVLNFSYLLDLPTPDLIYKGIYNIEEILENYDEYKEKSKDDVEGFVIRIEDEFDNNNFRNNIAKFVEPKFRVALKESDEHWMFKKIIKNKVINEK